MALTKPGAIWSCFRVRLLLSLRMQDSCSRVSTSVWWRLSLLWAQALARVCFFDLCFVCKPYTFLLNWNSNYFKSHGGSYHTLTTTGWLSTKSHLKYDGLRIGRERGKRLLWSWPRQELDLSLNKPRSLNYPTMYERTSALEMQWRFLSAWSALPANK